MEEKTLKITNKPSAVEILQKKAISGTKGSGDEGESDYGASETKAIGSILKRINYFHFLNL